MRKISIIALGLLFYHPSGFSSPPVLSDEQVRHLLITESIATFPGACPCPYSIELKKSSSFCGKKCKTRPCGGKSAWSWTPPGFVGPLCYGTDVSDEMVQQFLRGG